MERMEQRRVKLASLIACGEYEGYFARQPGECQSAFARRLRVTERREVGNDRKVARYRAAVERGERLPPVIVAHLDDELLLLDGWHRCAAAALVGHATVSAIVYRVHSTDEVDLVSELADCCSEAGLDWRNAARRIRDTLGDVCPSSVPSAAAHV